MYLSFQTDRIVLEEKFQKGLFHSVKKIMPLLTELEEPFKQKLSAKFPLFS